MQVLFTIIKVISSCGWRVYSQYS